MEEKTLTQSNLVINGESSPALEIKEGLGEVINAGMGIKWPRLFGTGHPYDAMRWEKRTAKIIKGDGTIVFEQKDVEVPSFWTQTSTDIVASKYFRGKLNSPDRESSVKQIIDRVAKTIGEWGMRDGYFDTIGDCDNFVKDLTWLLVNQYAAFNSPVWFNFGVYERPQGSACFILSVEDNMKSILDWFRDEGWIFKFGSGSGINLSKLRSSKEPLSKGGYSSGPVSFMKGADGVANSIRSGGTTRRAAKMVVLNVDHPDVHSFIYSKKIIEDMTKALAQAGFKDSIAADLFDPYTLLPYQNANNSVRVSDAFMRAVEADGYWDLKAVATGETLETIKAKGLFRWMADAAWHSADPGIQYDTTINEWHTIPNAGRINASNPCFTGDTLVYTNGGLIRFDELYKRFNSGEKIRVYTHNITSETRPENIVAPSLPTQVMTTGENDVYKLTFSNGLEIKVTENHRFWTKNRGWAQVKELEKTDQVMVLDSEVMFDASDLNIKADLEKIYEGMWRGKRVNRFKKINLPKVWTSPFAEYVGYMVGDGSLIEARGSNYGLSTASVVFGTQDDADELLPRFESITEEMGVQPYIITMPNGTIQMRVNRTPFVRFMKEIGVKDSRAHLKRVPHAIFQAPKQIVEGFLRGLFSADGCVYEGTNATRYVGLGSVSEELIRDVQQLLLSFGISSKIYKTRKPRKAFSYTTKAGELKEYYGKQLYDLRITAKSLVKFKEKIGFLLSGKQEKLNRIVKNREFYDTDETVSLANKEYLGKELTYNLTEPRNHSYLANGVIVSNCSEYMSVDNSACNLASLNLMKFLREGGKFNVDTFKKAVDTMILAQDIIVDGSSYPTEKITLNARAYRQLGLGYANLGSLLMTLGLPYDSDKGRILAGQITSLMCGEAYRMSAVIASHKGPFAGYYGDREGMLGVLSKHLDAGERLFAESQTAKMDDKYLETEARLVWREAKELADEYGVKNSQVTVLAPTGTISFLMGCDTTGIEPELALVKYKKLVGGGTLKLVNNQVPIALRRLGYLNEEVDAISEYILEKETIEGAPYLKEEHLPIFDCSFKAPNGSRSINYMGHIRMMAAAQPFISGAISKTVNLPSDATVEDIEDVFFQGWRLGLKALAVYRDGCKSIQPLSTSNEEKSGKDKLVEKINGYTRIKLPDERPSITHKFSVGGFESYLTVGFYPDTMRPGETFITTAKEGSTISGLFDTMATLTSMCLQSGVPLKTLVKKFKDMRFEPAGFTSNPNIPIAKSVIDYVFRYLGMKYLSPEDKEEIFGSNHTSAEAALVENKDTSQSDKILAELVSSSTIKTEKVLVHNHDGNGKAKSFNADAPLCNGCGTIMIRAGSCYSCPNCFATTGVCN
jgi:ribonucleoside-diphosphate reductase alpha chain